METRHAKIVLDDFGYVVGVTWPIGGGVWRYKAIPQHTKTGLADSEKEALEALEPQPFSYGHTLVGVTKGPISQD